MRTTYDFPTSICFSACMLLFAAYEDGLICCWDMNTGKFNFPMIGHANKVNQMLMSRDTVSMFSAANDCTVRKWNTDTGICDSIFKFANPISAIFINEDLNYMYTAHWDKMVRVMDINR